MPKPPRTAKVRCLDFRTVRIVEYPMNKRFLLLLALAASSAWAQRNVDITAEQFNSGGADGTLVALGRDAAASGKRLVVTAPQHWHAKIAARIRAGGSADVVLKDGFYETLLVRVEDKVEEPVKPEPKPEYRPEPARLPAPAEKARPVEKATELPAPPPAPIAIETPAPPPVVEQAPPPAPVVEEPPQPAPTVEVAPTPDVAAASASTPAAVDPKAPVMLTVAEPSDVDPARASLEKLYNDGKRIAQRIEVPALKRADLIYTGKGAAVVVRREGGRLLRMWLVGSLNVNQIAIGTGGANKYEVLNSKIE
ncbi:MAG: hypothetical protein WAS23_14375 [Dokdonella sp.]|uniref:hypothetical protein n=1 Tax=Dokdonella sp. TaxID=2291710 RepID=UPI003BAFBEC4